MRRIALGVAVAALLLPSGAQARVLGSAYDSGSFPFPSLISDDLQRTRSLQLVVTASPSAPFDQQLSSWSISCSRDFDNRRVQYPLPGPGTYTAGPTLANAGCRVSASASFADYTQSGAISITVYGESKPKPRRKKKRR